MYPPSLCFIFIFFMSKSIFHLFDLICHYGQLRSNWGISSLLNSQSSGLITYLSSWTLLYLNLFISSLFLHLLHLILILILRGQKYPIITCYSCLFLKSTWLISTLTLDLSALLVCFLSPDIILFTLMIQYHCYLTVHSGTAISFCTFELRFFFDLVCSQIDHTLVKEGQM